ncbi:MAG: glycosyltransferase [Cytophagales bacterium]|nr:glycosyltransferase [Cytophagales bacterium]
MSSFQPHPFISIVVLTYNRSDALLQVLRSLASQCDARHEVVIADDGSRAEHGAQIVAKMPSFQCPVRHVWIPDVGFTAARSRNVGASFCAGEYIIFLDGDCVPHKHFLHRHEQLMTAGCFVNGSRVLLSQQLTEQILSRSLSLIQTSAWQWMKWRLTSKCNKVFWLLGANAIGARILDVCLQRVRLSRVFRWRGIRSCNFGVWRSDFEAVNGFDETFSGWGHEDADLVLRLHHLGVVRKNGFWATEVFHLYHSENSRADEIVNRRRVLDRMQSSMTRADRGLAEIQKDDVVITNYF